MTRKAIELIRQMQLEAAAKTAAVAPSVAQHTALHNCKTARVGEDITAAMIAKKREMFPSHTDQQLIELIQYQQSLA